MAEIFKLRKKHNNIINYTKDLLKIKEKNHKPKTDKPPKNYMEQYKVSKKNKSSKTVKKTELQTKGEKVVQKDNTTKVITAISTACLIVLMALIGNFFIGNKNSDFVNNGTTINGVNVGGMEYNKAKDLLTATFEEKAESFELNLMYEGKTWTFNKNNFKLNSDIHTIMEEIQLREQINSAYESQLETVKNLQKKGNNINVSFNYLFVGLDEEIDKIINEINYEPVSSTLTFNPTNKGLFTITPHKTGLKVNKEQLYYDINEQFVQKNNVKVEIPTIIIEQTVR